MAEGDITRQAKRDQLLGLTQEQLNRSTFEGGVEFNEALYLERQGTVNEILARYPDSDEQRVGALNKVFESWDDEFGASYIYLGGYSLPGIKIHGQAEYIAFNANYAPGADFTGANMYGGVFTASQMPGLQARGADFRHAIMTLVDLSNADIRDVAAHDAVLNFANLTGADARGANLTSSYLVGARGLDGILPKAANITNARVVFNEPFEGKGETVGEALGDIFSTGVERDLRTDLTALRVFGGANEAGRLRSGRRMRGTFLHNMVITDGRMSGTDFEGTIWNDVSARGLGLSSANLAGGVIVDSVLDDADTERLKAPGLFIARSSAKRLYLPKNMAGGVAFETDFTGTELDDSFNAGGLIVIGGKPPELSPKLQEEIRILKLEELPSEVVRSLGALTSNAALPSSRDAQRSDRQLEAPQEG